MVSVFTRSQTRGTAEPVILRAQGLWELRGGAIKSEGALRLRGQLTPLTLSIVTQTAQRHGQDGKTLTN